MIVGPVSRPFCIGRARNTRVTRIEFAKATCKNEIASVPTRLSRQSSTTLLGLARMRRVASSVPTLAIQQMSS